MRKDRNLFYLSTSHCKIAVEQHGAGECPILFIHGNSQSREVFRNQLAGNLARKFRLIALDLPGHGDSGNAHEAERTYTLTGFADAVLEALDLLGVRRLVVVGWSLGGHIALEAASRFPGIRGLMIVGTPPVSKSNRSAGFLPSPHLKLVSQQVLSSSDISAFGEAIFGAPLPAQFRQAIARADGLVRKTLFERRTDAGADQRSLVESLGIPLAVVNGARDPFVNLDYLDEPNYANLWEGTCHRLPGAGHAPFWEMADLFDNLLERFVADVLRQRSVATADGNSV